MSVHDLHSARPVVCPTATDALPHVDRSPGALRPFAQWFSPCWGFPLTGFFVPHLGQAFAEGKISALYSLHFVNAIASGVFSHRSNVGHKGVLLIQYLRIILYYQLVIKIYDGERGIRTPDAFRHTRFRVVRDQPDSAISPLRKYSSSIGHFPCLRKGRSCSGTGLF